MKRFLVIIFSKILALYPFDIDVWLSKRKNFIYSCWISNAFQSVGKGTRFERHIFTKGGKNIRIGDNCMFFRGNIIDAWEHYGGADFSPTIQIGDNCVFGRFGQITACNKIVIGNNLLTGAFVIISDNNHGPFSYSDLLKKPKERDLISKGEVVIGDNVWLGDKVAVLSGVHIGDGVVVAANSVVTHDIPPYSMAAGVPAKIIKTIENN